MLPWHLQIVVNNRPTTVVCLSLTQFSVRDGRDAERRAGPSAAADNVYDILLLVLFKLLVINVPRLVVQFVQYNISATHNKPNRYCLSIKLG